MPSNSKIFLTDSLLRKAMTGGIGINNSQAKLLGVTLKKGWKRKIINRWIDSSLYAQLVFLKSKKSKNDNKDVSQHQEEVYGLDTVYRKRLSTDITYHDLLKRHEWKSKRSEILDRDKYTCQHCLSRKNLVVHHSFYYTPSINPWEYPNSSMITFCEPCHNEWHKNNNNVYKPLYTKLDAKKMLEDKDNFRNT